MTVEGVDYAWDRPTVSGLVAAGKRFVVRYGGPGSDGKQIQAAELAALTKAGIAVVANAEGTANGFRSRSAGIAWAKDAEAHFRGLGMPGNRPIYFSADWDVQAGEMDEVDAALRGAAEVIGAARVGLYGGYDVIRHAQSAGTARWFWQTYAWSGGVWVPGVHLQQYRNGVSLAGGTVDLNRAVVADYGQWGTTEELLEDDMTPADFLAILKDPKVAAELSRLPWAFKPADHGGEITAHGIVLNGVPQALATLRTELAAVAGRDLVDEQAIVAGLLAGLSPEKIAAAIPADLAQRVADELAARLTSTS